MAAKLGEARGIQGMLQEYVNTLKAGEQTGGKEKAIEQEYKSYMKCHAC